MSNKIYFNFKIINYKEKKTEESLYTYENELCLNMGLLFFLLIWIIKNKNKIKDKKCYELCWERYLIHPMNNLIYVDDLIRNIKVWIL